MDTQTKEKRKRAAWRIVLIVLYALYTAWIFSNSLKTADVSTEQSGSVVDGVQAIFAAIFPNGWVANAQGEDLALFHAIVRGVAHFLEFALLGALSIWVCRAYTKEKKWYLVPFIVSLIVAVVDECLQIFTDGRAFEWTDILIDFSGAIAGVAFAVLTLVIAKKIIEKKKVKEKADE